MRLLQLEGGAAEPRCSHPIIPLCWGVLEAQRVAAVAREDLLAFSSQANLKPTRLWVLLFVPFALVLGAAGKSQAAQVGGAAGHGSAALLTGHSTANRARHNAKIAGKCQQT